MTRSDTVDRVVLYADNLHSGVGNHTFELMKAFERIGVDAHLCSIITPDSPPVEAALAALPPNTFSTIEVSEMSQLIERVRHDPHFVGRRPVFVQGGPGNGTVALFQWLRSLHGTLITVIHNAPPISPPPKIHFAGGRLRLGLWWWRRRWLDRKKWTIVSKSIAVSPWVADRLVRLWGALPERLVAMPPGIDGQRFTFRESARQIARSAWGVGAEDLVVGSVGRVEAASKGTDVMIRALGLVHARRPAVSLRLVLVGGGDSTELASLQQLARDSGVGDAVIFAGPTSLPEQAWCGFDIVAMPSRFEGFSLSLLEAMAAARPVISSTVGSASTLIHPDIDGWLVAPDDVEGLADRLEAVAMLPAAARQRVGDNACVMVRRDYEGVDRFNDFAKAIVAAFRDPQGHPSS